MARGSLERELPHIFERFYQVEQIPEGPKSGSGIGLALASEYVKLLGGEIKVRE
jgi:signal transduction histidine kinase